MRSPTPSEEVTLTLTSKIQDLRKKRKGRGWFRFLKKDKRGEGTGRNENPKRN